MLIIMLLGGIHLPTSVIIALICKFIVNLFLKTIFMFSYIYIYILHYVVNVTL